MSLDIYKAEPLCLEPGPPVDCRDCDLIDHCPFDGIHGDVPRVPPEAFDA